MMARKPGLGRLFLSGACAALLSLAAGQAAAADVGETVMVRNDVTGTPPSGAARRMAVGDGVPLGLALATARASAIKMTFAPQGSLTLGPETALTIEQTVVDRATGRDTSKLSMSIGRLRVALGRMFGGDVEIKTPAAVIGVKGTDVILDLDVAGRLTVLVLAGSGRVATDGAGGGGVDLEGGRYTIVEPGGAPGGPWPLDARVRGLMEEALADFGLSPAPPAPRPDEDLVAACLGGGAAPGVGGLSFETATASPAAGGPAFSDPSLAGFPVPPFLNPQLPSGQLVRVP